MSPYEIDDLSYMVTLHCPGRCLNCNLWKEQKSTITRGEVSLDRMERALQSKALERAFYFDLTGGESQLSPRYVDAVGLIAKYHREAFLHTNISGWYPERHKTIALNCMAVVDPARFRLDVSLDGRPEAYRKVRLVPGGWERAVATIKALRELPVVTRIVFIAHKQNYCDIEWIADFAHELGIDYYIGFSRQANLLKNRGSFDLGFTPDEVDWIERALHRIGYLNGKRRSQWLWAKSVYLGQDVLFDCHMGRRALVMDPYGNVFPCNDLLPQLNMGKLDDFDGDLDLLLDSEVARGVLTKVRNRSCQPCKTLCAHKALFPWGNHTGMH